MKIEPLGIARRLCAALVLIAVGAGCTPQGAVIGVGAAVGRVVLQERSTEDALTDTDIELGIVSRIFDMSASAAAKVSVTSIEGRVLLSGEVESAEQAARIVEIAWLSPDVVSVTNEVKVADGGGLAQAASDFQLAAALRLRLIRDLGIADINYVIVTDGGTVHLAGLARDAEELRKAIWHVRRTAGVARVVSHVLTIDDPRRTSPRSRG
ncbi:MAG: osmotically-inducible protein OsmY [Paracoccaceae bacterium]